MTPFNIAMAYRDHGWPVFPTRAKEEIDERTGEVYAEKTPLTPNGLKAATTFPHIIKRWWSDHPDAMIAVPTGSKIGAWVLDLDVKPGVGDGHAWLADMEAEHGELPATARAKTLRGGTHIFFKHVDGIRNRGGLGQCVDIRGAGGYICAPGSVAADGRRYEWIDHDGIAPPAIADAPQWLLDLVLPQVTHAAAQPFSYVPGGNEPYIEAAIEAELNELATCPQGGRGYQLNKSAFSLGTLVGAGALSRGEAESHLMAAAGACGVLTKDGERETAAKIRRGLDAGTRQPRDIPEPTYRDEVMAMDFSRLIANAKAKLGDVPAADEAENAATIAADEADIKPAATKAEKPKKDATPKPNAGNEPDTQPATPSTKLDAKPDSVQDTVQPTPQPLIHATPFQWTDPAKLPRRDFLYGTHLIRKYVSVTVSPGGLGKTSLTIVEAMSMVTGKALLGVKPAKRLRCWIFNAEDPRDEMDRRIIAAAKHYSLGARDLAGMFVDSGREQELVVAFEERGTTKIAVPIVESVVEQILTNEIDVMVIDPFVSTHKINENDNNAIDRVAKLWGRVADETNCAIELVHHVRKSDGREVTVEDGRGAGALLAAARSARVLNRMSEDQASAAGLPGRERFSYFNVTRGKANMAPMSGDVEWRRMESVPLGNGQGLQKPQDHVGVVTQWEWPSAENVVAELDDTVKARIRITVDNGEFKQAKQAKNWAGIAVAEVLGLDLDIKENKARAEVVLRALISEGVLTVVDERDAVSRKVAKMVRGG